jgi:hypothetical protein
VTLPPLFSIGIITGITAVVGWIVDAAASIAAAVAASLAAVWVALGPVLIAIWHAIEIPWNDVIKPAWSVLKSWGEEVYKLYEDHVKPLIDALGKVSKLLRDVYDTFVRPFEDILSVLDQFLRLTGLINTAFGHWLDGEIHRVQGLIEKVWQDLTKPINLLLHLVNEYILDARGLLQAPLLLQSTERYAAHITGQLWTVSLDQIKTDWGSILDSFHTGPRIGPSVDYGSHLIRSSVVGNADEVQHGIDAFRFLIADDYEAFDYLANGVGPTGRGPER